jgi:hypothetical protein
VTKESHNLRAGKSRVWFDEYKFMVMDHTIKWQNEEK